jgi:hypothetical protein
MLNLLTLEEKITCGKIKSKAKTLFVGNIQKSCVQTITNIEDMIVPTIYIDKFKIKYGKLMDFNFINYHLLNSTIIISNSPNPKDSTSHVLVLPGYLCEINKIIDNSIELDINFKNFFPLNIPANINSLYFMIWFKNILPTEMIEKIDIVYKLENTQMYKSNIFVDIQGFLLLDTQKIFKSNIFDDIQGTLHVQQTQTFNVMCGNKTSEQVIKKTIFNNMCRAFWIKFNIIDYNNLDEFKIEFNGETRLAMTKNLIEMMCVKKIISSQYILLFVNLELGCEDWFLPTDIYDISKIYSNSCNMNRIYNIKFYFKFLNKYINDNIQITSLSINNLRFADNKIYFKIF